MTAAQTSPETGCGSPGLASAAGAVTGRAATQGEGVNARPRPTGPAHTTVDQVALERRLNGDTSVRLNIAEREEGVRRLHALGMNDRPIARRLGISDRTVLRIRGRFGLPAVVLYRPPAPHGTPTRYRHQGCRCDECRRANSDYCAQWTRRSA